MAQHIVGAHDTFQELQLQIYIAGYSGVIEGLLIEAEGMFVLPYKTTGVTPPHQRYCCRGVGLFCFWESKEGGCGKGTEDEGRD